MRLAQFIIVLITIAYHSFSYAEHSDRPIKIAAPFITSLVEKEQNGIYQLIMNHALIDLGFKTEQLFSPYKRALISFEKKNVDCIYSFTQVMQEKMGKGNIIYSFPLGAFAYSRQKTMTQLLTQELLKR